MLVDNEIRDWISSSHDEKLPTKKGICLETKRTNVAKTITHTIKFDVEKK